MINTKGGLYEYLRLVANECAPCYDCFDGETNEQVESYVWDSFLRQMESGELHFRFTKEDYLKNNDIIETLNAYNIDIEKFWFAILFIDHYTEKTFINAFSMEKTPMEQLKLLVLYLSVENSSLSVIYGKGKNEKMTITERRILSHLAAIINKSCVENENNNEFYSQTLNMKNEKKVSKSASYQVAYATERYQKLFKALDIDAMKNTKGVKTKEMNKLLLISRILYFTKMVDQRKLSYLIDDNALKCLFGRG